MGKFDRCSPCSGRSNLKCPDCVCRSCNEVGSTDSPCTDCRAGKMTCELCAGKGQVLVKKGLFSDKYGTCGRCRGARTVHCSTCSGKTIVKKMCRACSGKGRLSSCARCGGTGTNACMSCGGSGKVVSEWFKSLDNLPVDRLRFEHEKRERDIAATQREINSKQVEISRYSRELDEMYNYVEQEKMRNPYAFSEAGSYPGGLNDIPRWINNLQSECSSKQGTIHQLEEEIAAIHEVLDTKWRNP